MRRTATLPLIALAVLAMCGAGLALAFTQPWNHSEPAPPATSASPPSASAAPTPDTISDREQVALDAARIMTTWTPTKDLNRTAAELRARPLMTTDRAAAVIAPERPATGAEWLEAAEQNATSVPTVELNHATELTDAGVSVTVTWTWDSPNGSDIPEEPGTQPRIYYFEFMEDNEIHDYTYQ